MVYQTKTNLEVQTVNGFSNQRSHVAAINMLYKRKNNRETTSQPYNPCGTVGKID